MPHRLLGGSSRPGRHRPRKVRSITARHRTVLVSAIALMVAASLSSSPVSGLTAAPVGPGSMGTSDHSGSGAMDRARSSNPRAEVIAPRRSCARSAILVPSCGLLWGIYASPVGGQNWVTSYTDLESSTGRTFDLVKGYHGLSAKFPNRSEQQLGASGARTLYMAWMSRLSGSQSARWSAIAAGAYDASLIRPEAERIKAWGKKVFLSFDDEMDGLARRGNGTTADYVAAYRHIHSVFAAAGVNNVVWVWTPTGYLGNINLISQEYPGDAYVDWIAWDPYNFYHCNRDRYWKTPQQTFNVFYNWLQSHGHANKPYMLSEYGTAPDANNPSAKAAWFAELPAALATLPNIKAVVQFDSAPGCDLRVTTGQGTLTAFGKAGRNSYVTGG